MPVLDESPISCGIRTLSGLCVDSNIYRPADHIKPKNVLLKAFNTEVGAVYDFWDGLPTKPSDITFGIILFSDSTRRGNGKRLASYLVKEKLGKVVASDQIINPNSRRSIQMWTWYLDRPALINWFEANGEPEDTTKKEERCSNWR